MQLFFWRLAFAPRYPRERIFQSLDRFFEQARITSYVIYETLGDFDILLRIWTPKETVAEDLELLLRQHLQDSSLWNLNYLACKTELHWLDGETDSEQPPPDNVLQSVNLRTIAAINAYNSCEWSRHERRQEKEEKGEEWREGDAAEPCVRPAETDRLIAAGALGAIPLDTRGIRLFITFDHPRQPFRPETRAFAVRRIREKCDEIRAKWQARPGIDSPPRISIYAGAGSMTDFLVMVRAPHGHFHEFVRDLIVGLRAIDLDTLYEMRPYTHVISDRMFSKFSEHRLLTEQTAELTELLKREESESLEFKATLAVNFRSLIAANRRDEDRSRIDAVVKAICGLLNSPNGGTLILGVLEVKRELEKVQNPERYLQILKKEFGYSPDDEKGQRTFPKAIVGIEVDLDPGPFADPDQYVGRLREAIRDQITPNPWAWLAIDIEEIGDRHLCVVSVRPGDIWFYAKTSKAPHEEFFVREAASTPAYSGAESDLYKRAHPRDPRGSATSKSLY